MRITLLSFGFNDYTIQLANALSKKGMIIQLIMPDDLIQEYIGSIDNTVNTYIYNQPRFYNITNFFLIYRLFKQIKLFKPDIIHIQEGHIWFSSLLPILFIKKYILITTIHDPKLHVGERYIRDYFIQYLGRLFSNRIIVHGEKLKEIMIKEYNIPNEKVYTISIGECNVAPFKKYEIIDSKQYKNLILFFGRIRKYKGLEYLIKAEPLITESIPNVKIIIAGKGDFKKYEEMMINKEHFIIYNRHISYREGAELFQKSSIVVLPYIDASQSGVVVTAYGFKKPVIVTSVGSIPEIVDNNVTGIIVPPKDAVALATAIIKLLRDDALRIRMGNNAYNKLKKDLSWDSISEKTIIVYKAAIGELYK